MSRPPLSSFIRVLIPVLLALPPGDCGHSTPPAEPSLEDVASLLDSIGEDSASPREVTEWLNAESERVQSESNLLETELESLRSKLAILQSETVPNESQSPLDKTVPSQVKGILAEHCFACHGPDAGQRKARLRLDDGKQIFEETRSGEAPVVPGNPEESLLLERILASDPEDRMPPPDFEKDPTEDQIEVIRQWIESGANWPKHWAFLPPQPQPLPAVERSDWPRNGIDRFVLARLEKEKLTPSPEADRVTLIRRLSLDLTGIPPTPEEVENFRSDTSERAYENLVDRLLASPRYGEKWARWWLDLAAYADSDGYLSDFLRPWAYRYRDWVVEALNSDLPFDRFTIEQIAGDLLPDATLSRKIATGFFRNTLSNREGGAGLEEFRTRQTADRTLMLGTAWMALTLECAQCHDHKYDPISQEEFYSLYAYFNSADEVNIQAPRGEEWAAYRSAKPEYDRKRRELLEPVREEIERLQREWEENLLKAADNPGSLDYHWDRAWEVLGLVWGQNQGEGQLEGTLIVRTPIEERTRDEADRLQDYFLRNGSLVNAEKFKELNLSDRVKDLEELEKSLPPVGRAPTLRRSREVRPTHVHVRGDFRALGEEVTPSLPRILDPGSTQARDRLALAKWLVSKDHPLTSRVLANRLWQELFGQGIVATSDDFGARLSPPSHPKLLDWLAADLVEGGWSVKNSLKRMVLSATYRQSSQAPPGLVERDPSNVLLARQSRLRLSGELVRDSALAVSGLLNEERGGPSVKPPQPDSVTKEGFDNKWVASEGADRYRRGLYTFLQRTSPFGQSVAFDLPSLNRSCSRRERSNTPTQALNLLNDPVFFEAARGLAKRIFSYALGQVRNGEEATIENCVEYGFRLCLSRDPSEEETRRLKDFLGAQIEIFRREEGAAASILGGEWSGSDALEPAGWVALASVLLNLDEFIVRE